MLLSDFQRQCLLDFVNDKMNEDRNKITFFFHYLTNRDQLGDFADYISSSYGFKVSYEEWEKELKEKNDNSDSEKAEKKVEGEGANTERTREQETGS